MGMLVVASFEGGGCVSLSAYLLFAVLLWCSCSGLDRRRSCFLQSF